MSHRLLGRPPVFGFVALAGGLALVIASVSITSALATGTKQVVTDVTEFTAPGNPIDVPPDSVVKAMAHCPTGYQVVAGGWSFSGSSTMNVTASYPREDDAWVVQVTNPPFGTAGVARAVKVCLKLDLSRLG